MIEDEVPRSIELCVLKLSTKVVGQEFTSGPCKTEPIFLILTIS